MDRFSRKPDLEFPNQIKFFLMQNHLFLIQIYVRNIWYCFLEKLDLIHKKTDELFLNTVGFIRTRSDLAKSMYSLGSRDIQRRHQRL